MPEYPVQCVNKLMTCPKGNSEFFWPSMFPEAKPWRTLASEFHSRGNKINCFLWSQSWSVLLYLPTQKQKKTAKKLSSASRKLKFLFALGVSEIWPTTRDTFSSNWKSTWVGRENYIIYCSLSVSIVLPPNSNGWVSLVGTFFSQFVYRPYYKLKAFLETNLSGPVSFWLQHICITRLLGTRHKSYLALTCITVVFFFFQRPVQLQCTPLPWWRLECRISERCCLMRDCTRTVLTVFSKSLGMKGHWDCTEVSHTFQRILVSHSLTLLK